MVSFIKIGRMTDYMKIVSNKKMMTNVMNIKSGHVFCFRETYYMKLADIGENCAVNLLDGLVYSNSFFKSYVYEVYAELHVKDNPKDNNVIVQK